MSGSGLPDLTSANDDNASGDTLRIDDALCFALYAASRAVTTLYRPRLRKLGLTYPQYLVMLVLWERDGIPIKSLAEQLKLDHGTLSPLLKRLAAADLISRARPTADERTVLITVTAAGWALRESALCIPPEIATAMNLDSQAFADLRTTLKTLADTVEHHQIDPSA